MLKLPTKVDNKIILVAPLLLGVYLAIMYPLHGVILSVITPRYGFLFINEYPILTLFLLYIATIPLAIVLNKLLLKRSQNYDEKLLAALGSNVAFNICIAIMFSFEDGSVITLLVFPLVFSFFGFLMAALLTALMDKIETLNLFNKSN